LPILLLATVAVDVIMGNRGYLARRAQIETKARQYAHSGYHSDFSTIEARLIKAGYQGTRKLFANPWTQQELNRICRQACEREKARNALLRLVHSASG
jgi:hypothetical protein